jgi:hypothetical protein
MANVQNILNAAKKQKSNGGKVSKQQRQPINDERVMSRNAAELNEMFTSNPSNQKIEGLDYMIYPNGEERKVYDASEEMREIREGVRYGNVESKMPNAILRSVLSNPLDVPIPSDVEEKLMSEELQNRTVDIIGKLESRDRSEKAQYQPRQNLTEVIDYQNNDSELLTETISRMIDEKFARLEKRLASHNNSAPGLRMIKLNENSTMMFMDEDNNVYECKLIYKGKGKVRR